MVDRVETVDKVDRVDSLLTLGVNFITLENS